MAIPFRNAAQVEAGGNAAFIRTVPGSTDLEYVGALLQINALGEPIEFVFNRMQVPSGALWRADDLPRYVNRTLLASLFQATQRVPLVLCCLAGEVDALTFTEDVLVQIPVCRVVRTGDVTSRDSTEWLGMLPGPEAPQRKLIEALARRDLLLEPFDRILAGLQEALGSTARTLDADLVPDSA
jgi:hypothetical protein